MRIVRAHIEPLQWFALGAAPLAWAAQLVVGFGLTVGKCGPAHLGVDRTGWELGAMLAAATVAVLAEVTAGLLFAATREDSFEGAPPAGRRRFFILAAAAGNVLFLGAILLSGLGSLADGACRQA